MSRKKAPASVTPGELTRSATKSRRSATASWMARTAVPPSMDVATAWMGQAPPVGSTMVAWSTTGPEVALVKIHDRVRVAISSTPPAAPISPEKPGTPGGTSPIANEKRASPYTAMATQRSASGPPARSRLTATGVLTKGCRSDANQRKRSRSSLPSSHPARATIENTQNPRRSPVTHPHESRNVVAMIRLPSAPSPIIGGERGPTALPHSRHHWALLPRRLSPLSLTSTRGSVMPTSLPNLNEHRSRLTPSRGPPTAGTPDPFGRDADPDRHPPRQFRCPGVAELVR